MPMEQEPKKDSAWDLVKFGIIAVLIVVPIRLFVAQPFIVSGSSMSPTFSNGDYLIVDEISYRLREPERGDVIIFRYPKDKKKFFIKRVIGLPNEQVDVKGSTVTITSSVHPEGMVLDQPYVKNKSDNSSHFELKAKEYFVMGDNRSASSDSRYWGAVKEDLIVGRALLRLLPIRNADMLPGYYQQAE